VLVEFAELDGADAIPVMDVLDEMLLLGQGASRRMLHMPKAAYPAMLGPGKAALRTGPPDAQARTSWRSGD
jgi:hypothetical protein